MQRVVFRGFLTISSLADILAICGVSLKCQQQRI